jgi:hypothetical protein
MADFDDLQTSGLAASNFNSCLSTIFSPPKIEESMQYACPIATLYKFLFLLCVLLAIRQIFIAVEVTRYKY